MRTLFKNVPGFIGYLAGSFFIFVIWLVEKIFSIFKVVARKLDL